MGLASAARHGSHSPLRLSGRAEVLRHSYAALAVDEASLHPVNDALNSILGDSFDQLVANREDRDGVGSYHMTILTPRELRELRKILKAAGRRIELPEGPVEFEILGIGTAVDGSSRAWFAVCRSEAVAAWRSALELPAHDLHITLAFGAGGDVHGVSKGIDSLITD